MAVPPVFRRHRLQSEEPQNIARCEMGRLNFFSAIVWARVHDPGWNRTCGISSKLLRLGPPNGWRAYNRLPVSFVNNAFHLVFARECFRVRESCFGIRLKKERKNKKKQ